jgi:nucleotide-binding universal stress UspA family protein
MRYVVATDTVETSELVADYLAGRLDPDDEVYAVNSQFGGDETSSDELREGEAALAEFEAAVDGEATVETHQFVRGNRPEEDVLQYADEIDADELVFSVRDRSPAGKAIFGSVSQRLLLQSDRPMRVVPREE